MDKKTADLSEAMKKKMAPKSFTKNPIQGTKYAIAIQVPKGVWANQHLPLIWQWL